MIGRFWGVLSCLLHSMFYPKCPKIFSIFLNLCHCNFWVCYVSQKYEIGTDVITCHYPTAPLGWVSSFLTANSFNFTVKCHEEQTLEQHGTSSLLHIQKNRHLHAVFKLIGPFFLLYHVVYNKWQNLSN